MADKKISQLNTATTIFDADDFTIVQDGETKQANASTVKAYAKDGLSKSDVGLGNVDNTSDANKPVSTATQTALDSKQATTAKNAANGYAGLDANAKLPTSLLPALAISEYLGSVANQAARLALTGQKGDWCSQTNDGKVYVITGDDPTDNANWTALTYPVTPGITLNGTSIAPGDTATISAATTNTLTIGTGLSGTSFNGSSAVTIAIDSSVVTLTGTQTLTNKTLTSPTINGGTANNVAIGGTTPAAGNFTTLGATGNVTLGDANTDTLTINAGTTTFTQGTANGVLYLNGSKVATSGSGLVFDGANLGVGVASPLGTIHAESAAASGVRGLFKNTNSSNGESLICFADKDSSTNFQVRVGSVGNNLVLYAGNTEIARLTSKGLLVGYTSDASLSGTGNAIFSGNLGLGVTPSAWGSDYRALNIVQFGTRTAALYGGSGTTGIGLSLGCSNNNTSWVYSVTNAPVGRYEINGAGSHLWFTAPSGTAGAAISFVQDMTLTTKGLLVGYTSDASLSGTGNAIFSGNVGIGTSSPTALLDVAGNSNIKQFVSTGKGSTDAYLGFSWNRNLATGALFDNAKNAYDFIMQPGSNSLFLEIYAPGGGVVNGNALVMTPSGNLGLGAMPNTWQTAGVMQGPGFSISPMLGFDQTAWATGCYQDTYSDFSGWKSKGAYAPTLYAQRGANHTWCVTNQSFSGAGQTVVWNQAMTLNASGNLLVGSTVAAFATGERFSVVPASGNNGIGVAMPNANAVAIGIYNGYTATGTQTAIRFDNSASQAVGTITCTSSSTSYNPSSDISLKENIRPITDGLERVAKLKPVDYNWKADGSADNGFIAQDLLDTDEFAHRCNVIDTKKDGTKIYGVDYMKFVGVLTAAIQELHAEIKLLKSRIN